MLEQVVSRDMLTAQVRRILHVAHAQGIDAGVDGTISHTAADASRVLAALQAASVLPPGEPSPVDKKAFIPQQEQLSLLQALVEQAAHDGDLIGTPGTHEPGPALAPQKLEVGPAQDAGLPLAQERVQAPGDAQTEGLHDFDMTDPLWAKTLGELIRTAGRRQRFALRKEPPATFPLADDARVILVADWGTGGPAADRVAAAIRVAIAEAGSRQCHVIHLGDVYYAGTSWEAERRFLDHWPVDHPVGTEDNVDVHSWCLNGNHDMYAAGEGLMQKILPDPRFQDQRTTHDQTTTQLHLKGSQWQIIGLDTSWEWRISDLGGLHGWLGHKQASWLARTVTPADRTIVLTHHQPFSRGRAYPAELDIEDALLTATWPARRDAGIEAWFWGHEHRCVTYPQPEGIDGLGYGACIGHGAVPAPPVTQSLVGPTEWELDTTTPDSDGDEWRTCGFAVIDFSADADPEVRYLTEDPEGEVHGPDSLSAVAPVAPPV